jgi:hypothetical protein
VSLKELYPVLIDNNVFIPAGECGGVGIGGHGQKFGSFVYRLERDCFSTLDDHLIPSTFNLYKIFLIPVKKSLCTKGTHLNGN